MEHQPVLLQSVIEELAPQEGEVFADLTAGYGGHAAALLDRVGRNGYGYLFDRDPVAIQALQSKFADAKNVAITQANFGQLDWEHDLGQDMRSPDMILLDLGVSSPQLDDPSRGFSFRHDGPLDMRMDSSQPLSAATIVNDYSETEIADLIYRYGQDRFSRRIAHAIVATRSDKKAPITTTQQLADIVHHVLPRPGKTDTATKTFQALRIAVNGELEALTQALAQAPTRLAPGGRLAIISFHSLEDRLVKQAFRELTTPQLNHFGQIAAEAPFQLVTRKPVKGEIEDSHNPRARSARLRAVAKNKN